MLADFKLYETALKNLLVLTDNNGATEAKKKALMVTIGGVEMVWLWEYVGNDATQVSELRLR